ncbi:MAG: hypothetical protein LKM38_25155 [Pseudomonas veronii]|nr:hypothetical protein [Pseudomonas veronii]
MAGSLLRAVHFGMALAAAGLVLSGLYLWLERRRLKAGGGWQVLLRLVIGGGGGLLAATAVLLCAGALGSANLAWWFWGGWLASLLLACLMPPEASTAAPAAGRDGPGLPGGGAAAPGRQPETRQRAAVAHRSCVAAVRGQCPVGIAAPDFFYACGTGCRRQCCLRGDL